MTTISISNPKRSIQKIPTRFTILDRYLAYIKKEEKQQMLWYMKVIMVIPMVFMVPSIYVMGLTSPFYLWFVGMSIILFYANVIAHISETKSSFYIPLYHLTNLLMVLIPLISYLLS